MSESVTSPDGRVAVTVEAGPDGGVTWAVARDGNALLLPSPVALDLDPGGPIAGLRLVRAATRTIDETYPVPSGKVSRARNHCRELEVSLEERDGPRRSVTLAVRAYDEGAAMRLGVSAPVGAVKVTGDRTAFRFPADHRCFALRLNSFTTNYEKEFDPAALSGIAPDDLLGLPLLVLPDGGPALALAEASLDGFTAMYLAGTGAAGLRARLAPRPDDASVLAHAKVPFTTPWRAIMVADEPVRLVESMLLQHLNPPAEIEDLSWIKPGRVAWPWWSGEMSGSPGVADGMHTDAILEYVRFASEFGLEYVLIDAGWNRGGTDRAMDILHVREEVDLPRIVREAARHGIGILLWLNWKAADRHMHEAFPLYASWGIKGVKIDYMDRDDQAMVAFYHRAARLAAAHRLLVDFHGAYKPDGYMRTLPNVMTHEGILGLEYNKWSDRVTPRHNVTIPFTRMLAGPMDYTPGGMRQARPGEFAARMREPLVMGTRAHQLAMYVVYESPLQMLSDHPGAYRGDPAADFLKAVPAGWDETRGLAGEPGEFVVIARRRGAEWFLGAMSGERGRRVAVPASFLGPGDWVATRYADDPGRPDGPRALRVVEEPVGAGSSLELDLAPGGGCAIRFVRAR